MPLSPKSTGFSDNGLSYEVAGDYNKLLGQALANYEARTSNPQSYQETDQQYKDRVGAASGILGNELAPLGIGNSLAASVLNRQQRNGIPAGARTLAPGSTAIHFDQNTGQWVTDFTAPAKQAAETRYKGPTSVDIFGKPSGEVNLTLPEWRSMSPSLPDQVRTNAPIAGYLDLANRQLGGNASSPAIVAPGQRGKLTREMAIGFLDQAKGDKELARKLARQAGHEF